MADQPVLAGKHFQAILASAPLNQATFLCQGSSSMLFEHGTRLYRLTLEGCLIPNWLGERDHPRSRLGLLSKAAVQASGVGNFSGGNGHG